ncbi:YdcF family protein [Myceligenerans crystallogenes]|uniref:YdcF family protein n=1 Tax=Myceligenerans crystallogenes TaxID=316335 RepID=A0ABP4ZXM9_9MICO
MPNVMIPAGVRSDVETLWAFHDLRQEPRAVDVCIGLGGHDTGVADYTAALYHEGYFPRIVFTGANATTTVAAFPRGEAVGYRDRAVARGVPDDVVLVEPEARNTAENVEYSRRVLAERGIEVGSVMFVTKPYHQRRVHATCAVVWPEVQAYCVSPPMPLDDYVSSIGDVDRVIDMLVGDTQRLTVYAERGFIAAGQDMPGPVRAAFDRLVEAGYTSRLVPEEPVRV